MCTMLCEKPARSLHSMVCFQSSSRHAVSAANERPAALVRNYFGEVSTKLIASSLGEATEYGDRGERQEYEKGTVPFVGFWPR